MADEACGLRPSKFREATMNSTTSIHPPPPEYWKELGIDELIEKYNQENHAAPSPTKKGVAPAPAPTAAPAPWSALGRFSRAVTSLWHGSGFSSLGKRKAEAMAPEKDTRKEDAEAAYEEAKKLGLLPSPKVFTRPVAKARKTAPGTSPSSSTPTVRKSPSKKDLQKQHKLSKRVSDLEFRLAEARKELSLALNKADIPPVPALPALPPTPNSSSQVFAQDETSPRTSTENPTPAPVRAKITKKRKASASFSSNGEHSDYNPVSEDNDSDYGSSRSYASKRSKQSKAVATPTPKGNANDKKTSPRKIKRANGRLSKKKSATAKEDVVVVVPDGVTVPHIPSIPNDVDGNRVAVGSPSRKSDDGYGGLGHEMF